MSASEEPLKRPKPESLAGLLRRVFSALPVNERPLHEGWRSVLNVGDNDVALYEALSLISAAIGRLDLQIDSFPDFEVDTRALFKDTIAKLIACTQLRSLASSATHFQEHHSQPVMNNLMVLSEFLRRPFPEALLAEEEIQAIREAIFKLQGIIEAAAMPTYLKSSLLKQIATLRWSLENWGLIGVEGLTDTVFKTASKMRQSRQRSPEADGSDPEWFNDGMQCLYRAHEIAEIAVQASRSYQQSVVFTSLAHRPMTGFLPQLPKLTP